MVHISFKNNTQHKLIFSLIRNMGCEQAILKVIFEKNIRSCLSLFWEKVGGGGSLWSFHYIFHIMPAFIFLDVNIHKTGQHERSTKIAESRA